MKNPLLPDPLPEFAGKSFDIVAFGPHPDDLEHTIGGALMKWAEAGKRILLCHLTGGQSGGYGSGELRRREAAAAAEKLGVEHLILNFEDANIRQTKEARHALIEVVRAYRPKIILATYFHFATMHPDHEATGRLAHSIFRMVRFKGVETKHPPHAVKYLFYYLLPPEIKPTFVIDVSDVHERWWEVARCYESQLEHIPRYKELLVAFKKMHTITHPTADFVEAFYSERPLDLTDVDLLTFL